MRTLDDVMLRLGALRVSRKATARAQGREVLTAREQLVHIALVTRVEHDRVARRVEDAVHRDRQLDHAEVRPQVATGLRHLAHEELADLPRELSELLAAQPIEVARPPDR